MFRKRFEQLVADIPVYLENNNNNNINLNESKDDYKEDSKEEVKEMKSNNDSNNNNNDNADNDTSKEHKHSDEKHSKHKRVSDFYTTFMVGDIVKVRQGFMMFEGVVVDSTNTTLDVDFGDDIETVSIENCCLVMNGLDFEVGDYVSACPAGELYFNGKIISINTNGTFDILFDGDDIEDVEHNIRPDKVRKIRTGRQLVINRWQRAKNMISMGLAWAALGHGNDSEDIKESKEELAKSIAESKDEDLFNSESKYDDDKNDDDKISSDQKEWKSEIKGED